jgi:hypothetical protein
MIIIYDEIKQGDVYMGNYEDQFNEMRRYIEEKWDELFKGKSSSSFDNSIWHTDDGEAWCFNAKKYTLKQAVEIVSPKIKKETEREYGKFNHVAKSFVRHRCGAGEDGPTCGWWFGDYEYGYHAVPVWMFTWDNDYYSIEEAFSKYGTTTPTSEGE